MATTQSMYSRYVKPRLESDPEFRAKYMKQRIAINVKKMQTNPEYKLKHATAMKTRNKQRYDEDNEYRERQKTRALQRYYEKKALKSAVVV